MPAKITIDLETHEVPDAVALGYADLEQRLDTANRRITELESESAGKDQRVDSMRGELAAQQQRFDGAVRTRVELELAAAKVLGQNERFDGLSDRELRERAVRKVNPNANLEGRSDEYVEAAFDQLVLPQMRRNDGILLVGAVVEAARRDHAEQARRAASGQDADDDVEARLDEVESKLRRAGLPQHRTESEG